MAAAKSCIVPSSSSNVINRFQTQPKISLYLQKPLPKASSPTRLGASSAKNEVPLVQKKKGKARLVTISTADGRYHGDWSIDYAFSLRQLQIHGLSEDVHKDTVVSINLFIQKHAGLGLSVEGKITTSFTTKCCNCCSPYLREINSSFKVWILTSTRQVKADSSHQIPYIGVDDDPSVIYVKPGYDADLDPLIEDTIRLATSVEETCSDSCEKAEPQLQHLGARNTASIDRRWHKLLELKKKT